MTDQTTRNDALEQMGHRDLSALLMVAGTSGTLTGTANAADDTAKLSISNVFSYAALPVTALPDGRSMRHVLEGLLPTGEFFEIHQSVLPAGKTPHPPHKHPHTEVLFIQSGKLVFLDEGTPKPVGPGDIVFAASNAMHGLTNVGDTDASYIVVSVGKRLKEG
jgi:quercetin dioxygenase-like cupin family protein